MVTTAVESKSAFQHNDAPFAAGAPPLSPTQPALVFICASRGRLRTTTRQHHAVDTAVRRGVFVRRRAETAIAGREIRRSAEDCLVAIQRGGPQGDVGWSLRVNVVRGDD